MTTTLVHCDRCHARIEPDRTLATIAAGPLLVRGPTIDRCPRRGDESSAWLSGAMDGADI
jgi:hypothetical protein